MMKKIIILFLLLMFLPVLSFAYFNTTTPVEGDSIANNELQFLVVKELYSTLSPRNPLCNNFSISNTQLLHYPYDVVKKKDKYVSGYWKELWTINMCGKKKQIPVTFYIKKKTVKFQIDDIGLKE